MTATGDCYEAAGRYIATADLGDDTMRLCHGTAMGQGPIAGIRHGHAWIELNDILVLEVANGNHLLIPRSVYYAMGEIENIVRYSPREAAEQMVQQEHWGPWHRETPTDPKGDRP